MKRFFQTFVAVALLAFALVLAATPSAHAASLSTHPSLVPLIKEEACNSPTQILTAVISAVDGTHCFYGTGSTGISIPGVYSFWELGGANVQVCGVLATIPFGCFTASRFLPTITEPYIVATWINVYY